MSRAVVCVATGPHFLKGQARLETALATFGEPLWKYSNAVGTEWPSHQDKPFAFKAYALHDVASIGQSAIPPVSTLLYCDASILPIRPLATLWEKIERDGYLIMRNGWSNYQWTADSAYRDLFPEIYAERYKGHPEMALEYARQMNRAIPHVVGGVIGLDLRHEVARQFLGEYYRLASETRAFCGPIANSAADSRPQYRAVVSPDGRVAPCGPSDVLGHRHDQTAASVIAWRLVMKLTDPPEYFSYALRNSTDPADYDPRTVLIAHGAY